MRHVDALSRYPLLAAMLVEECEDGMLARLRQNQLEDEELREIRRQIQEKQANGFVNGLLCKEINSNRRTEVDADSYNPPSLRTWSFWKRKDGAALKI